jgi:hypothetical protein
MVYHSSVHPKIIAVRKLKAESTLCPYHPLLIALDSCPFIPKRGKIKISIEAILSLPNYDFQYCWRSTEYFRLVTAHAGLDNVDENDLFANVP